MTLVDTSVWIEHLRRGSPALVALLEDDAVLCHRFVIGELACGSLGNRKEILHLLQALPEAPPAEHDEVMQLIDRHRLSGRGLGWVDVHLLASALLAGGSLWTQDKALAAAARELGLAPAP